MPRNVESRFALNPTSIDAPRTTFERNSSLKTSFNVGDIIPFYCDEVLPGDTFNVKTSFVARLQTLLTPVMDNIYLDTYYFYVPNRIIWEHWIDFMGENRQSAWLPQTTYQEPQVAAPSGGWNVGTLADYFGIPTGVGNFTVSALPFRAYAKIIDDWFRDENLQDPLNIPMNETTITGVNTGTFVSDVVKGGLPYKAAKYHDFYTSCLPAPQRGPDVSLSVISQGTFPVVGNGKTLALTDGTNIVGMQNNIGKSSANKYYASNNDSSNVLYTSEAVGSNVGSTYNFSTWSALSGTTRKTFGVPTKTQLGSNLDYSGLVVDLPNFGVASINQLRQAFMLQQFYEKNARGGSRYIELLKSHFGVTSPDARLQRPEYLGGSRVPLNINQVVQNSETGTTPQGTTAGYSVTTDRNNDFTKSFTEHGFIIGLCVARYDHSYQQGLEKFWTRKDREDYYWPVFANIGEQAVKNSEIYLQGSTAVNPVTGKAYDDEVFGYQEAWAEYRYKPSKVTGEMRSSYATSLDVWHLADDYSALPALSDSWIREDKTNVDRVLAINSSVSNQLFADFYIQNKTTRAMPMYSIPGLTRM